MVICGLACIHLFPKRRLQKNEKSNRCNTEHSRQGSGDRCVGKKRFICGKVALSTSVAFTEQVDIFVMDAGRAAENSFERRMETVRCVRKNNPSLKTGLLCDNVSDPEIARKVKQAKETGIIDVFFYESVQTDYLCDVVDSL